jgi:phospholipid transport system substrate-binding protein
MIAFRYVVAVVVTLSIVIVTSPGFSQDVQPVVMVKTISQEVIAAIKADKAILAGDSLKLAELADTRINPHFDFRRMTQSAMAKNWRVATPEQQERLTTSFKTLLVGTYSKALVTYRDRTIDYRALRGDPASGEVTVRSELAQNGQQPMVIDYDLGKSASEWKIFDIKVDGASLIVAYRESFTDEVRNHGIDGLIATLDSKNLQNKSGGKSIPSDSRRGSLESR